MSRLSCAAKVISVTFVSLVYAVLSYGGLTQAWSEQRVNGTVIAVANPYGANYRLNGTVVHVLQAFQTCGDVIGLVYLGGVYWFIGISIVWIIVRCRTRSHYPLSQKLGWIGAASVPMFLSLIAWVSCSESWHLTQIWEGLLLLAGMSFGIEILSCCYYCRHKHHAYSLIRPEGEDVPEF